MIRSTLIPRLSVVARASCAPSRAIAAPRLRQQQLLHTSAVRLAVSTRFTEQHEWVQFDDATNTGLVGITDYAQNSLGDVVYAELPAKGSEVEQGAQIGAVESVKAASDIYAPVSGTIETVNEKLNDEPGLINKSPEADGWLCKTRLANPGEFEALLSKEAYAKFTEDS